MIEEYFSMLEDWKLLPGYKLEVRIDSLVGFSLPKVVEYAYDLKVKEIIPELPIRKALIYPEFEGKRSQNHSYKVDFYIRTKCEQNLFIEFKTDSESRRGKQDHYLRRCVELRMKPIVEGILRIYQATKSKRKYDHLLGKLKQADLIDSRQVVKIDSEEIRVIYVQPKILEGDESKEILDFENLAKSIKECFPTSELMNRLALSIKTWEID